MNSASAGKRAVILLSVLALIGAFVLKKNDETAGQDTYVGRSVSFVSDVTFYTETEQYRSEETGPETSETSPGTETSGTEEEVYDPRININTAGLEALITLPGIGEVKARAVIEYRKTHGPFSSPDRIMRVSGIGKKTYEKIKDLIRV